MGALVRGDRCSLEAEAVTVEVARRAAASVQTTLTAVTGVLSMVLSSPALTRVLAQSWGCPEAASSVVQQLMAMSPVGQLLAPSSPA